VEGTITTEKKMREVRITWTDSMTVSEGWASIEDYVTSSSSVSCVSLGFLINEDDEKLVLAMNYDPDNDHVNQTIVIPRVSVEKIEDLEAAPKAEFPLTGLTNGP
jgi:hypothetical protein